jgi:hypothetical protein
VLASHANARALTPTDRHLSDAMLDALAERDAVVGLVLGNPFLDPAADRRAASFDASRARRPTSPVESAGHGWASAATSMAASAARRRRSSSSAWRLRRLADAVPPEHRDGFLGGQLVERSCSVRSRPK